MSVSGVQVQERPSTEEALLAATLPPLEILSPDDQDWPVTRMQINSFLQAERWPKMQVPALKTACQEAEVALYKAPPRVGFVVRSGEAYDLLTHMTERPFLDPSREVPFFRLVRRLSLGGQARDLGAKEVAENVELYGTRERRHVCEERQRVETTLAVTHAGAVAFMRRLKERARKKNLYTDDVEGFVASCVADYAKDWERSGYALTIPETAIRTFVCNAVQHAKEAGMTRVTDMDSPESSGPTGPEAEYQLSPYGSSWRRHAACRNQDPQMFVSEERADTKKALAICKGCETKGDCLLAALVTLGTEVPTIGVAGNMTEGRRNRLSVERRLAFIAWLESTRPSAHDAPLEKRQAVKLAAAEGKI